MRKPDELLVVGVKWLCGCLADVQTEGYMVYHLFGVAGSCRLVGER